VIRLLPLLLLLLAMPAAADCRRPAGAAEQAICADPGLRAQDEELARLYARVQQAALPKLRGPLNAGQRAWLAARSKGCDLACLRERVAARLAAMRALAARISDPNPTLSDLLPFWLEGRWRAGALDTPGFPPPRSVWPLPPSGTVMEASAGSLCSPGCGDFGLEPHRLTEAGLDDLPALLGVAADAPYLLVMLNGKAAYGLVPSGDGIVAVQPGCDSSKTQCGWMRQRWEPASPEANLHRAPPLG
jgi:uncharacterized protein YecT (DUF1311 family)